MIKQALSFTPASAGSAWLSRALLYLAVSPSLPGPGRAPWPPDASLSSPSRHQQPSRPYPPLHRPSPQQTVGRPHRGRQISADDPVLPPRIRWERRRSPFPGTYGQGAFTNIHPSGQTVRVRILSHLDEIAVARPVPGSPSSTLTRLARGAGSGPDSPGLVGT